MKYLAIIFFMYSSTLLLSCRNTPAGDPTKDVVEDFDEIMQHAEEDVKEVIIKDSSETDNQ